ncbi:transglutaminase TgpA family protein [Salimicrobium flavidum]|uniref:Transglutaminase-like superfamily protein n=1 Tax=Salimicrobium flavidum TaxID=570947 RepID=A0A1N7KC85_9BACI|nr:transglutaminaseTgpA domain-containing protein [Salimicrobium flavidum]SIS59201.1 Transglutaminase-like superfamily protein [Salimicrobium flavidum]
MKEKPSSLLLLFVYAGSFLLLLEWLWPLEILTNTERSGVFYLYAAFCFFLAFMQVYWYISIPLKLLGLLFILDGLFIGEQIFSESWWFVLYDQLSFNIEMIRTQEWWELTAFFRSLLFLVLLWLVSYLLHFWIVIAKKALFFIVLTFVYISVIDTFTPYDGEASIIRTFVIAAVVLGLLHLEREFGEQGEGKASRKRAAWSVLPLIGVILIAATGATVLPKFAPQWPDPVPYLQSATGGIGPGGSGNTIQKVGYGENDSRLGGSFVQDDTLVFQAIVRDRQYWRIESKNQYTGKGWEDTLEQPVTSTDPAAIDYSTVEEGVETETFRGFLNFTEEADFQKLVYPYGTTSIGNLDSAIDIALHPQTGEMETRADGDSVQPQRYSLNYDAPSFELNTLRETPVGGDPASIQEKYLQLPSSVTDRTRELAADITAEHDDRYDKAKAIESYFSGSGFQYSTTDVEVPEGDEDYVDQFLFETQKGYCDNFSTSMIVMLRAEEIPARWVKGFTGGEIKDTDAELFDETMNSYDVTSANAHSWVEVHFPEVGWVPFEPTQGFSNNADFYTELDTDSSDDGETEESPEVETPDEQEQGNPQQMEDQEEEAAAAGTGDGGDAGRIIGWSLLGLLLLLGVVLYVTRLRWLAWYYRKRFENKGDAASFQASYHHLLRVLNKKVQKRRGDETLRAYAKNIDQRFESRDMQRLTNQYERLVYRKEDHLQTKDVSELWENLIKKALS